MVNSNNSNGASKNNRTYVRPESSYVSSTSNANDMNRSIDLGNQNQYSVQKQQHSKTGPGNTIYSISQYARNKKNQSNQNSQNASVNRESYMTIDNPKDED